MKRKSTIGTILIVIFCIIVILMLIGKYVAGPSTPDATVPKEVAPKVVAPAQVTVGDNVTIDCGSELVIVAVTKADLDEITRLSIAGDNLGIATMIADGNAFMVNKGTKARVIERGLYTRRVRIMDGDYYGESGWVPMEFCHK